MSSTLTGIIAVLIGLAVCFLGYRLFRILLPLAGLIFGYAFGASLVGPEQWLLAVIIGVAAALVVALLSWFFWSVAVVIGGAILGFGFGWTLGTAFFVPGLVPTIIAVAAAVIFAVLFALLRKMAVMLSTAAGGAGAAVYGLGLLLPSLGINNRPNIIATVVIIALAVVGFFVQYSAYKSQDLYADIGY